MGSSYAIETAINIPDCQHVEATHQSSTICISVIMLRAITHHAHQGFENRLLPCSLEPPTIQRKTDIRSAWWHSSRRAALTWTSVPSWWTYHDSSALELRWMRWNRRPHPASDVSLHALQASKVYTLWYLFCIGIWSHHAFMCIIINIWRPKTVV